MADVHFPPAELEVMSALWKRGRATVAEVRSDLRANLAYTTVLSTLQKLEQKGCVGHMSRGRAYVYYARIPAKQAGVSALRRIRDAIFHGSTSRLFAQLVSDRSLSKEDLAQMRRLLAERRGPPGSDTP